jgi:hypothetical protein
MGRFGKGRKRSDNPYDQAMKGFMNIFYSSLLRLLQSNPNVRMFGEEVSNHARQ